MIQTPVPGPNPAPEPCVENCHPEGGYIKKWGNDIHFDGESGRGVYRKFLKNYGVCDPPGWWIGMKCKYWDDGGYITLEAGALTLPTKGRLTFAIYKRGGRGTGGTHTKNISMEGQFVIWNEDQGFTMWVDDSALGNYTPSFHRSFRIEVEEGDLNRGSFRANIYYNDGYIGFAHVYTL